MSSDVRAEAVWLSNRASLPSCVSVNAAWCPQPFLSPAGFTAAEARCPLTVPQDS